MLHFENEHLTVFQSTLYKTTTAIVETDNAIIMTDPNWLPEEIETIKQKVNYQLSHKRLYIIYTHSDFDHIMGSGAFPESTIIASEAFQTNPKKEKIVQDIHAFDQQYYIERSYTPHYPIVDKIISRDGEEVIIDDLTLTFYTAPGHTQDSLFIVIKEKEIFLSGDYLSDVEFPFIYSSYNDYVDTIDKAKTIVKQQTIHYHVPGHGNVTKSKKEIQNRIDFSQYYLKQLLRDEKTLEKDCRNKFSFFEGMKDSHYENIKIAKKIDT